MLYPQLLLATAVLSTLLLSGCDAQEDEESTQRYAAQGDLDAMRQLNRDNELAHQVVMALRTQDPSVQSAYFKLAGTDSRTLVVVRRTADGQVEEWEAPAGMVDKVLEDGRRAIKAQELLRRLQARDASFVAVNIVDSDPTASSVREGVVVARRQTATGQWDYTFPEALFLSLERSAGAKEVLEALRQRDPNISNVSLGLQGSERVFQVTREELSMNGESFMPRTYALLPAFVHGTVDEELAVASLTAANSAPSATTGTSVSGAIYAGSAATGMLLGYMLGNAFRPNAGVRSIMSPQQQEERRAGATSGYSAAITNNARTVSISSRGRDSISRASKASPTSAARVGVSRGGSFSGTGARAGGYGGGS